MSLKRPINDPNDSSNEQNQPERESGWPSGPRWNIEWGNFSASKEFDDFEISKLDTEDDNAQT